MSAAATLPAAVSLAEGLESARTVLEREARAFGTAERVAVVVEHVRAAAALLRAQTGEEADRAMMDAAERLAIAIERARWPSG